MITQLSFFTILSTIWEPINACLRHSTADKANQLPYSQQMVLRKVVENSRHYLVNSALSADVDSALPPHFEWYGLFDMAKSRLLYSEVFTSEQVAKRWQRFMNTTNASC
jgi:hypothetical protein